MELSGLPEAVKQESFAFRPGRFKSNGDDDPHIPLARSEESKAVMEKLGAHVTLKIYPGRPHTISDEEIQFVKQHFPI